MTKFLISRFIRDYENTSDEKVRERYGVLAGAIGIICNLLLVIIKLSVGLIMNSIAVVSDGLNNLSDMGSSLVSLIGAMLSNKRPDRDHPYGHGRFEYIAALIVAFIIVLVGFETFTSSAEKIISPEDVRFSAVSVVILLASCFVKLWMWSYNRYMGEKINSSVLKATAKDSLNDTVSTLAVIAATVAGVFFRSVPVDGILGVVVSVIIFRAGIGIAKETVDMLLGGAPDGELVKRIHKIIMSDKYIIGVHDLLVHDYGPGRIVASVHAEVPDNASVTEVHEVIDALEKKITDELGVIMVIHMDPIAVNCPKTAQLKEMVCNIVSDMDSSYSVHDFRITDGEENINLIFDLVLPISLTDTERKKIAADVSCRIRKADGRCSTVINIDTE